jgi:hypothetical protein
MTKKYKAELLHVDLRVLESLSLEDGSDWADDATYFEEYVGLIGSVIAQGVTEAGDWVQIEFSDGCNATTSLEGIRPTRLKLSTMDEIAAQCGASVPPPVPAPPVVSYLTDQEKEIASNFLMHGMEHNTQNLTFEQLASLAVRHAMHWAATLSFPYTRDNT